jgi:twinkle protein
MDFADTDFLQPSLISGQYFLADLPQRGSVAQIAYGTGWPELDDIFKFYPGQFVVVTGLAGSGKSTFMFNVLAKLAIEQGISPFMYVPENEASIVETVKRLWPGTDAQFQHFSKSQCVVQSAVPHSWTEPYHDIDWVLKSAEYAVTQHKSEVILLDPWNEFDRIKHKDQLMTDYIGEAIKLMKQFTRYYGVSIVMVAHPTKNVLHREDGNIGLGDIEGSMHWYNKCDNGLIIKRNGNSATVISAKVREQGAGAIGQCNFNVDRYTGKFTPMYGSAVNVIP